MSTVENTNISRYSILKNSDWDQDIPLIINQILSYFIKKGLLGPTGAPGCAVVVCSVAEGKEMLLHGHKVNKLTSSLV